MANSLKHYLERTIGLVPGTDPTFEDQLFGEIESIIHQEEDVGISTIESCWNRLDIEWQSSLCSLFLESFASPVTFAFGVKLAGRILESLGYTIARRFGGVVPQSSAHERVMDSMDDIMDLVCIVTDNETETLGSLLNNKEPASRLGSLISIMHVLKYPTAQANTQIFRNRVLEWSSSDPEVRRKLELLKEGIQNRP